MARIDTLPHFLEDVADSIRNKLGSDYQQVEYIESTGGQYIDTGVTPGTNIQIETEVEVTTTNMNIPVFGCYYDGTTANTLGNYYHLTPYNNKWYFGGNNTEGNGGTYNNVVGTKYNIKFNDLNSNIIINDSSISTAMTFTGYNGSTIAIGRRGGNANSLYGVYKYYRFKMYDKTTLTYIRDFIPCYRVDDGEIGLYDLVNEQFYPNNGTGNFLKGPDVKELPSEYQEVEYIESTGTQYIDTGYLPNANTIWKLKCYIYEDYTEPYYEVRCGRWGANNDRFSIYVMPDFSGTVEVAIGSYYQKTYTYAANQILNFTVDATTLTGSCPEVNYSHTYTTQPPFTSQNTLYLFGRNATGSGNTSPDGMNPMRIYSHRIWENGTLVQNFVPCYRKSDNVIGMYDLVNDVFYTNAGTGTFIKGPLKKIPEDYQQVEYIESNGRQYIDTGIKLSTNFEVNVQWKTQILSVRQSILASYNTNVSQSVKDYWCFELRADNTFRWVTWQEDESETGSASIDTIYDSKIVCSNGNATIYRDGVQQTTLSNLTNAMFNLLLCDDYRHNTFTSEKICIYSCSIINNGVLVRDFIPCYRKEDNAVGLYDMVTGTFFENSGTGEFIKGSIVNPVLPEGFDEIPATEFDVYIDSIPNTPLEDFFNGDFANSSYTKDAAGLKSFFYTEYFNPKYYPLAVDVNQKFSSSAYKDDKTVFCLPSLLNVAYACDKAFSGCNNIILSPDFEITIPASSSRPAEMFANVYATNLTGKNVKLTLNAQTYWPDGMFGWSYRIGEGPLADTKYFDITYNFTGSSNTGTLGGMFADMARNNPNLASTSEQSNYIVTIKFNGLNNWNAFTGTSWNDNQWDYYSRIVGGCAGKVLNLEGLKFTTQTYRTHRMFQDCLCSNINLTNCSFTGSYNFKRWFYNCSNLTTIDLSSISNTHPYNVQEMFAGCTSLMHIDLRTFTLSSATTYTNMFGADATVGVPDNCEIIVSNDTQKSWVQDKFSRLTNVKTITEYEGGN